MFSYIKSIINSETMSKNIDLDLGLDLYKNYNIDDIIDSVDKKINYKNNNSTLNKKNYKMNYNDNYSTLMSNNETFINPYIILNIDYDLENLNDKFCTLALKYYNNGEKYSNNMIILYNAFLFLKKNKNRNNIKNKFKKYFRDNLKKPPTPNYDIWIKYSNQVKYLKKRISKNEIYKKQVGFFEDPFRKDEKKKYIVMDMGIL